MAVAPRGNTHCALLQHPCILILLDVGQKFDRPLICPVDLLQVSKHFADHPIIPPIQHQNLLATELSPESFLVGVGVEYLLGNFLQGQLGCPQQIVSDGVNGLELGIELGFGGWGNDYLVGWLREGGNRQQVTTEHTVGVLPDQQAHGVHLQHVSIQIAIEFINSQFVPFAS